MRWRLPKAKMHILLQRAASLHLAPNALPSLTKRLAAAKDDDERIEVTYLLAGIIGPMKFKREPIELPPELVSLIGRLLFETRNLQLEANLANFTVVAPHPAEFGPGLLALLERTENEALRATTSAAIVYQGKRLYLLYTTHSTPAPMTGSAEIWHICSPIRTSVNGRLPKCRICLNLTTLAHVSRLREHSGRRA